MTNIIEFYKNNTLDKNFDEKYYAHQFPETKNFYQPFCERIGLSEKHRLYYHYCMHGYKYHDKPVKNDFINLQSKENADDKEKNIYLRPINGIGNRILMINSAINFAKQYNFSKVKIAWGGSAGFSQDHFEDLFSKHTLDDIVELIPWSEWEEATSKYFCLHNKVKQDKFTLKYIFNGFSGDIFKYISRHTFCHNSWICFDYMFPRGFTNKENYIKNFTPSKIVKDRMESYNFPDNMTGIHIRQGDASLAVWAYRYGHATLSSYIHLINNYIEDENIFLCTDCELSEKEIVKNCPGKKIYTIPKQFVDKKLTIYEAKEQQLSAAEDFFTLSKCKKIYGNEGSTFCKVAATINNVDFEAVNIKNFFFHNNFKLPDISLTVGVKNRFKQLRASLNSWILQDAVKEILIVNWDSDDITNKELKYLKKLDKRIRHIKIKNQPNYENAKVLDLCLDNAKYDHILKMDVDYIINPYYELNQWLEIDWDKEFMAGYWGQKVLDASVGFLEHLNGFMAVHRKHTKAIGGYNKDFVGYGWEDCEIYIRLIKELGLKRLTVPISENFVPMYHMPHQDYERMKNHLVKDRETSRQNNLKRTRYSSYDI